MIRLIRIVFSMKSKQVNIKISDNFYTFLESETDRLQNSMAGVVRMYLKLGIDAHQKGRFEKIERGELKKI